MLRQSFFWKFHQVRRMQFSGQIIDNLLLRLLKSENTDELWFRLRDNKVARFNLMEFLIVTGLNAGNEDEVRQNIQRSKRLLNKYFNGKTTVTPVELESTFDACTVMMEDKYKLGLVYILETMLRCKHHKTSIDVFCLDVVDNIEVFNAYPWGRRCFMDTLHAFKRIHMIKGSKTDQKYDVYEFPLAMQLEVHTILTPTPEEMENMYIQGFYIPARLMTEITHLNKKVEQLSKKFDEVIEWVRPIHYTNTMAPETTSDRVPIESDRMRDQEVMMEMETREILEF
ncbi:protein of unknown function (DUF1985) [Abeliophyllum distichum]|uniref:DUF1985 domain-containing protein n=1 Tax=Abeliophyllum distichum TaxID=126358 RepID=A0ABD1QX31_9LAMI